MSKISELSFKEAIKLAKRIKVKGGVGAKTVDLSNRGDSLNKANIKSEHILKSLKQ